MGDREAGMVCLLVAIALVLLTVGACLCAQEGRAVVMKYDVKVYECKAERETIRGLTYGQALSVSKALNRHQVRYKVLCYHGDELVSAGVPHGSCRPGAGHGGRVLLRPGEEG